MAPPVGWTECLVIGATGMIGRHVGGVLRERGIPWQGTCYRKPVAGLLPCDITRAADIHRILSTCRPRAVFHCANLTGGVDFCESHPQAARVFHVEATQAIGTRCQELDAAMVFFSTDYIFDDSRPPYSEEDAPHPLNVYGKLKLEAEQWIRQHLKKYVVIRTTNVYGWDPHSSTPNYLMSLYQTVTRGKSFQAPSFLWSSPTYADDLARAAVELYVKQACGVFHVVGGVALDRFHWALEACRVLGLDASLVKEIARPSATMVPRPLNARLRTDKFTSAYDTPLRDAAAGLASMKSSMGNDL